MGFANLLSELTNPSFPLPSSALTERVAVLPAHDPAWPGSEKGDELWLWCIGPAGGQCGPSPGGEALVREGVVLQHTERWLEDKRRIRSNDPNAA